MTLALIDATPNRTDYTVGLFKANSTPSPDSPLALLNLDPPETYVLDPDLYSGEDYSVSVLQSGVEILRFYWDAQEPATISEITDNSHELILYPNSGYSELTLIEDENPGSYSVTPTDLPAGNYLAYFYEAGELIAKATYFWDGTKEIANLNIDSLQVLRLLGYQASTTSATHTRKVSTALSPDSQSRVVEILSLLVNLDTQILNALEDSAIIQTCKTQMNWPAHIKMLRQQAHSLLHELARIYDIEVANSKYAASQGRVQYSVQYQ